MFTKDQMVAWENKPAAVQTWAKLQTDFTKKWLECKQYSATTAKQSCFKEAVLLAQVTAAVEDECKSQAMLFALLQEQHNKQIAAMTATNKANMDAMMERMNALVTGGAGRHPAQIQTTNMQLSRQSILSSISQAHMKLFFGTMHQRDSHQKKIIDAIRKETTQHGQN